MTIHKVFYKAIACVLRVCDSAAVMRYFMLSNSLFFIWLCQAQRRHVLSIWCLLLLSLLLLLCASFELFIRLHSGNQCKNRSIWIEKECSSGKSPFYYSKWSVILHSNGLCNANNTLQIYYGFYMLNIKTAVRLLFQPLPATPPSPSWPLTDNWIFYFRCIKTKTTSVDFLVYNLE